VGAGVAAVVLWPAALWQHRRLVTLTLALGLLLLVPHVAEAIARTGSPLGIVRSAVEVTDTTGPLTAAVRYARWLPATIAGPAGIAVLAAAAIGGLVAGRQALRARTMTPQVRRYLLVLVPAIAGAIGIVLVSHPEPRYMLGPLALGAIAGGGAVAEGLRRFRRTSVRRRAMGANAALALVAALVVFDAVVGVVWLRGRSDRARVQLDARAGEAIAADARGPCVAVASQIPVTGWYSRCLAVGYGASLTRLRTQLAVGLPAYVVLRTGDDELIGTKKLSRYQRLAVSPPLATIVEETRRATVNRLKP